MRTTTVSVYPAGPIIHERPAWQFSALVPETDRERELGLVPHPGQAMMFHDARAVTLVATPFPLDVYACKRSCAGPVGYLVIAARSVPAHAPGIVAWAGFDYDDIMELPAGSGPLVPGDVLRLS